MLALPGSRAFSRCRCFAQTAESYRQHATELSRRNPGTMPSRIIATLWSLNRTMPLTHYDLALALKYKGESQAGPRTSSRPRCASSRNGRTRITDLGAVWYDLQDQTAALKELRTAEGSIPAMPRHIGCWRELSGAE